MGVTAGRQTTIEASPEPITMDTAHAAVIVVDMQNDFCSKGGLFDRVGINISAVRKTVGPTRRVLSAVREAGIKIVYLKMGFRPDLSDVGNTDSPNRVRHRQFGVGQPSLAPDGRQGRFLIRDTWNTDVIDELRPQPEDVVLYKHRFSGFYQTELDDVLRRLRIRNLIFTGCTTSVCVDSTIRDAMFRDYRCVLLADCAGEPIGSELPRSNHEASILTIETLFGWVSDSERFVSALQAGRLGASRVPTAMQISADERRCDHKPLQFRGLSAIRRLTVLPWPRQSPSGPSLGRNLAVPCPRFIWVISHSRRLPSPH